MTQTTTKDDTPVRMAYYIRYLFVSKKKTISFTPKFVGVKLLGGVDLLSVLRLWQHRSLVHCKVEHQTLGNMLGVHT